MGAGGPDWWGFLKKHWGAFAAFIVAVASAFAGAIYVFVWFVGNAQSSGLVPKTLGLWTMSNLVSFILHAVFWELVLVGIPVAIAAAVAWQWWKRLPYDERRDYFFGAGGSRSTTRGGGLSFLFFLAFCTKVYLDGNWNVPIGTFTFDYFVGSMLTILEWGLVIFGIPVAIGLAWWISREIKRR